MQVLFGRVDSDTVNTFGSDDLHHNGHDEYFYYGIQYPAQLGGYDECVIHDTCGREIPVDVESLDSLIEALIYVRDYAAMVHNEDTVVSF